MDPERMRAAVADYVTALHRAYLAQADTFPPAVRGAMPLLTGGPLQIAAVGARNLHLLATREGLGPLRGQEVAVEGSLPGLDWTLRFYDPVVAPALGLISEDAGPAYAEVRGALGVTTVVYHVVAQPGSGLTPHHAGHIGAGLAAGHTAAARDFETIRTRVPGREALVDELVGAAHAGLPRAQALLARAIAPRDEAVAALADAWRGRARTRTRSARRCWPRWAAAAAGPHPHDGESPCRIVRSYGGGGRVGDAVLSTVSNAARLLKEFRSREASIGVSELARRLGLGKSGVHRLLTTLVAEGLLERDPQTGGYRLGIVMFELGEAVKVHLDLHAAAGPVLAQLREQTGESSQVGVLDGVEVVYVDRLESAHSLRLFTETGRRVPAHCTSSGKVLLAHQSEPEREAFLARPLPRLTPHTIVEPDALRDELTTVRARGWAEAVDEREIGVASLAAPIRDVHGDVVAAISIGAPVARFGAVPRRRHAPALVEAGEAISRRLGWNPESGVRSRDA